MKEINFNAYLDAVQQFSVMQEEPLWMLELRKTALAKIVDWNCQYLSASSTNAGHCLKCQICSAMKKEFY